MRTVIPSAEPFECRSSGEKKAPSPGRRGTRSPSAPAAQPSPAMTSNSCACPAGCSPMMPPGAKYTQYTWTSPLPLARCTLDAATASNRSMGRACSLENSSLFIRCLSEEARLYPLRFSAIRTAGHWAKNTAAGTLAHVSERGATWSPAANYSGPSGLLGCRMASLEGATMTHESISAARREFLKFLVARPYVAALGGVAACVQERGIAQQPSVITDPADALSVLDFEEAAHRKVQPGHWAYMASGVDDDATLHANREVFKHVQLRPRRLHDPRTVDMTTDLFGAVYASPIYLCPTGGEKSFHADGELAVARAAKARNTLQVLSTAASTGIEDVNKTLGRPVWYQLYAPNTWEANEALLKRVEAAGCTVIALT